MQVQLHWEIQFFINIAVQLNPCRLERGEAQALIPVGHHK